MSDESDVGYGKPPKGTRFQPGTSGNPGGRPRKRVTLSEDLAAELDEDIQIADGGRSLRVSKQRALLKMLIRVALGGDARAGKIILDLARATMPDEGSVSETDAALVEAFVERELKRRANQTNGAQ
jgi:hypothetical protein